MAGGNGNLGNLFFTLGIKVGDVEGFDKFMKELDKPKEELSALEKYAKKHLDSLSKANQQYIKELSRIEKAQGKLDFKEYIASLTSEKSGLAETTQWLKQKAVALNAVAAAQSRANRRDVFMTAVNNLTAPKAVDNADYWRRQERLAAAANTEFGKQGRLLTQLKTAAGSYVSIWTASQFIQSLVRITGEFELQRVSLRAMLNDINAADKIFSQTKALAVQSPFQFMDLMGFSKQLAAFSVPVSELFETTKMLSDISAGLGVDMGRIVLAYSQIRSAAVLRGSEVRQLTEAGVPILEDLAKMFTQMEGQAVTIGEVFERISTRQVPFEMVEQAFKNMTSEGGKFYRMQEVQAETLRGQVTNLIDAWQIAMYELGSSSEGFLKGAVGAIRSLIENFHLVVDAVMAAVAAFGAYNAVTLVMAARNGTVTASFARLSKSMKQLGAFLGKNPWAAAIAALAALGTVIWRVVRRSNELKDSLEETAAVNFNKAEESVYGFNKLIKQLTEAEKGSKNYSDAVSALNAKYGEYLPNLLSEADALDVVTSKYESITKAIYAKAQAQAYEAQMNKISEEYDGDILEAQSELVDKLVEAGMLKPEAYDVVKLFNTRLNERYPDGIDGVSSSEIQGLMTGILKEYLGNRYSSWDYRFLNTAGALLQDARNPLMKYVNLQQGKRDMEKMAASITDSAWGDNADYNTAEERRRATDIENIYKSAKDVIDADGDLSTAERYNALLDIRIDRLKALRDMYHEMGNTSKEKEYESEIEKLLNTDTSGWIQKASEIKDVFAQLYFRPDYEGPFEHFDRWKQDYDDVVEKLSKVGTGNLSDSAVSALENQRDMLNKLSVLLGFGEGFENYGTIKERQKAADKEAKERLDMIRDWIKRIQDLKDLYTEFKELGVQDANMVSLFGSMLGELGRHGMDKTALDYLKGYDFDNAVKVYTDMLRQGTPEMSAYADEVDEDALEESMRKRLKELQEAEKISERLRGVYEELAGIMAVSGSGVEHDFSKIVSDLRKQENDLRRERDENRKDVQKRFDINENVDEYNSAMEAVDRLYNAKLENIQANAGEKIRDLASKYVDEQIKANRLDLSDYADKTIKQIRGQLDVLWDIYGQIQGELVLAQGEQTVTEALGEDIDSTLLSKIEMLKEALAQLGIIIGNTGDEKLKKIYNNAQSCVSAVSSLGGEIAAMGSEMENANLEAFGNALQDVADIAGDLISSLSSGNWTGFVIGLVTKLISAITGSISNEMQEIKEYEQNLIDFQNALKSARMNISEDDYDTIFGTNSFQKAADAYKKAQENLAEYQRLSSKKMEEPALDQSQMYVGNAMSLLDTQMDAYERGLTELQGMAVKTRDRNGFMEWLGFHDEFTSLADLAPDIFNNDGSLNVENAKLFLETNTQISDEQRKQIQNVIDAKEQYEELMGIVKDVNAELMSEVSDDISNAIFDAVLNGADAWDAFNDSAVRVIDNIGRKMIQEFIVQSYLNQFQDELEAAWGKEDTPQALAEILFDIYGGLDEVLGEGMEAYQDWLDMMQANGLDISSLYGQGESLGKNIQRITEDQADLLASYVNAIRAYVAQIVEQGIKNGELLSNINETINEAFIILKEINSNTAAINGNTAQIERLMRSLTTSGSAVAINARMM